MRLTWAVSDNGFTHTEFGSVTSGAITTNRTDEMDIIRKIKALRIECGFAAGEFQERMRNFNPDGSRLWNEGANQIFRDHGLTLEQWYLLCEISA